MLIDPSTQNIRLANIANAKAIAEVMIVSRNAALPYLPTLYTLDQIQRWIETTVLNHSTVWIAEENSRPVGFLAVSGKELDHLYVHPDYWSKGIGSQLITQAKEGRLKLMLFTFQRSERSRKF